MTAAPARAVQVALALVLAALAAVVLVGEDDGREVTVVFERAHGLVAGARVVSNGVPAGEVTDIRVGADGLPRVRVRVDPDLTLRETATATLRLRSNSGELNRVVELAPGRGDALRDGAVLPLARTTAPVELDDVLGTLDPEMRDDTRRVLAGLDDATKGLASAYEKTLRHSAPALTEAAALLRGVTRDGEALRQLVTNGHASAQALARNRRQLGETVSELAELLATTAGRDDELRATVRALPAGLRASRLALDDVRTAVPDLRALVRQAAPVSRELQPTARALMPALREAAPALRSLTGALRDAPEGMRGLRRLVRAATPLAERLGSALDAAGPALDTLRVYAPELMGFLAGWSGAAASYDAAGHAVRIVPSQAPIPNTTRSADSLSPGYLAAPFLRVPGTLVRQPWTTYEDSFIAGRPSG